MVTLAFPKQSFLSSMSTDASVVRKQQPARYKVGMVPSLLIDAPGPHLQTHCPWSHGDPECECALCTGSRATGQGLCLVPGLAAAAELASQRLQLRLDMLVTARLWESDLQLTDTLSLLLLNVRKEGKIRQKQPHSCTIVKSISIAIHYPWWMQRMMVISRSNKSS